MGNPLQQGRNGITTSHFESAWTMIIMAAMSSHLTLKASVCNFDQNFNIHTLRDLTFITGGAGGPGRKGGGLRNFFNAPRMIIDAHANSICGQKLNRNRTFFNPRSKPS